MYVLTRSKSKEDNFCKKVQTKGACGYMKSAHIAIFFFKMLFDGKHGWVGGWLHDSWFSLTHASLTLRWLSRSSFYLTTCPLSCHDFWLANWTWCYGVSFLTCAGLSFSGCSSKTSLLRSLLKYLRCNSLNHFQYLQFTETLFRLRLHMRHLCKGHILIRLTLMAD